MNTTLPTHEMEQAYLHGDASYNGLFLVAVRTTGIFCRPTCPARKPLPKNVEFFPTAAEALRAGYRPCKRCRPLSQDDQPAWAADLLADVERDPAARVTDDDLLRRGVDPATVRRYFVRQFGMTFQAYTRSLRMAGALSHLRSGGGVDEAVFESGYESHSGFRDAFTKTFGNTPGDSRDQECVFLAWLRSPLGPLLAGATSAGLCLLEFTDRRMLAAQLTTLRKLVPVPVVPGTNDHLKRAEAELAAYFDGKLRAFTVPLVYPGTDFQRRVWDQLLAIPYGETRSYEQLAQAVGEPNAARAVGRANGLNRLAVVIPCHRVVNKGGALGGYGGGLRRKEFLLELERASVRS